MYLQWQPWINKIRQLVTDREAWRAAIHGVAESDTTEWLNWTELNPNYLGNTNKWMKRPILHLFNCRCSCFLNMSIQRNVIAGVPQYSGKLRYLKLPIFNGYYCFSAEFQDIKYWWSFWHSAGSSYYRDKMEPVSENFSFIWWEKQATDPLVWCPLHTI